jgi:serine protease Do
MKKFNGSLLTLLVVVLVIGFLSGVVGELWLNSFLMPDSYFNFKNYSDLSQKIDDLVSTQDSRKGLSERDLDYSETIQKIKPTVVSIYKDKKFTPLVGSSLIPTDYLGQGLIITNDGWLVTYENVVKNEKIAYSVVTNDNQVFKTEKVVIDEVTGAVFLKVAANNLPVAEFNLRENLVEGQSLFVFGQNGGVADANIKDLQYTVSEKAGSLLRSSEVSYKYLLLDEQLDGEYLGSPVVSLDGRVSGLVIDESGLVLPLNHFTEKMKFVVQDQEWERPYLGINFYDLSEVLNPEINQTKGVMIAAVRGVDAASPAKGILLEGDILLEIEGEELSASRNLSDLMAEYHVGDSLNIKIKRGAEEKEVEVVLGKVK